jgi:hypothetical protein
MEHFLMDPSEYSNVRFKLTTGAIVFGSQHVVQLVYAPQMFRHR